MSLSVSQTYSDFDLLIWDDGSLDIALSLAHLDSRIRVFPGHHQGVASSLKGAIAPLSKQSTQAERWLRQL